MLLLKLTEIIQIWHMACGELVGPHITIIMHVAVKLIIGFSHSPVPSDLQDWD